MWSMNQASCCVYMPPLTKAASHIFLPCMIELCWIWWSLLHQLYLLYSFRVHQRLVLVRWLVIIVKGCSTFWSRSMGGGGGEKMIGILFKLGRFLAYRVVSCLCEARKYQWLRAFAFFYCMFVHQTRHHLEGEKMASNIAPLLKLSI